MDIFWDILGICLLFLLGACVGTLISTRYLEKSMDELVDSYRKIFDIHNNIAEIDHRIITCKDKIIRDTYLYLVNLRYNNTGDLDEIIGALGELLDDHPSNKEETTDAVNTNE